MNIEDYAASEPSLKIEHYFAGETVARHVSGPVRQGSTAVESVDDRRSQRRCTDLDEHFIYSDGSESNRIWKVNIMGDGHYLERPEISRQAIGRSAGNAFNFKYQMRLPIRGREWVVTLMTGCSCRKMAFTECGNHEQMGDQAGYFNGRL